ncbi:hypothetical protein FOA52_014786 [Chlamydomonas sp. UWO 241]|nr:hypothetical protein FOA52_014786 [Chlamydomonas sp. UWO 241]
MAFSGASFQQPHAAPGRAQHSARSVQPRAVAASLSSVSEESSLHKLKEFGFARGFEDHFDWDVPIGKGSFGTVRTAINKVTKQKYAVKSVAKKFTAGFLDFKYARRVRHEVDIYSRLKFCLGVAHMYAVYEDERSVSMVMELCSGGELWARVKARRFTERQAAYMLREILRTVSQCHTKGIIIRDIKPDNFLFAGPGDNDPLKMIDFGLSAYCQEGEYLEEKAGSFLYVAPEVLKQHYDTKADLWSTGIVAYELLTGRFPFVNEDNELLVPSLATVGTGAGRLEPREINRCILLGELDFTRPPWNTLSPGANDFVQSLLGRNPWGRPTAIAALSHPWLLENTAGSPGRDSSAEWSASGRQLTGLALLDTLVQRLQRYAGYPQLKQVALRVMASFVVLEPAMEAPCREAAKMGDPSGSGKIMVEAVTQLLQCGRFDLSPDEIAQLLSCFHITDGEIVYWEWMACIIGWRQVQANPQWDTWVERVFNDLDYDGSGEITANELQAALCDSGPRTWDEDCPVPDSIPSALREVGKYESLDKVKISLPEFRDVMRTKDNDRLEFFESRRVVDPAETEWRWS